jgi:hypothetical protein
LGEDPEVPQTGEHTDAKGTVLVYAVESEPNMNDPMSQLHQKSIPVPPRKIQAKKVACHATEQLNHHNLI